MSNIVAFLTAQLDAEQAEAEDVQRDDWNDHDGWAELAPSVKAHARRYDRARILTEIAAKWQLLAILVEMCEMDDRGFHIFAGQIECALAAPYKDVEGYVPSWRVM